MNRIRGKVQVIVSACVLMLLLAAGVFSQVRPSHDAYASAGVTGDPNGATDRVLISEANNVRRIVYFAPGVKTMVAANTPVASDPVCGVFGSLHGAEVELVGTMSGTAPTLGVKWQNSKDGGTTWNDVGTWTTINATVTPAVQTQSVADVYNNTTAVAYGDCWRATYVFGGTGAVGANIGVNGIEK